MSAAAPPWAAHQPARLDVEPVLPLDAFRATVASRPEHVAIHYGATATTFAELDRQSTALAGWLAARGVGAGDRVAVLAQNDPQAVVAQLAIHQLAAIEVVLSPMLTSAELEWQLGDSGAVALVALRDEFERNVAPVLGASDVRTVLTTTPASFGYDDGGTGGTAAGTTDLRAAIAEGLPAPRVAPLPADAAAMLVYTSGTSGRPKAARISHGNVAHSAAVYAGWLSIGPDDVVLAGAPLFHITGLIAGIALSHRVGCPLVLGHRFTPAGIAELVEAHRCTFTVMATTAYRSILLDPDAAGHDLSSLAICYSGGAPVPVPLIEEWRRRTGHDIHVVYGLTETTSPSHLTPLGRPGPVDDSGAMAVGVPVTGATCLVVDHATGEEVAPGTIGELVIGGPMVVREYWRNPEASARAFTDDGLLRTGDAGWMTDDGWFFVVDRFKDMINASGYKVWPREVEEAIALLDDVVEAAVVGVPDDYRGETVHAYVVLAPGADVPIERLRDHCRRVLSRYKCPAAFHVVDELPKTASGKILRRELR